ncbi:MAG: shikimate kinase [Bryobacteraceae bacterium]
MNAALKATPGIYVVGFMASGKTTIGQLVAKRLGWTFVDLDDDIERAQGLKIAEIFDRSGEAEFRRAETEALRERVRAVKGGIPLVVALGGGAFVQPANAELLAAHGVTVWLDCPFEIVQRRVAQATHRPLARDPAKFAQLYQGRQQAYSRADHRVEIAGDDPEPAVRAILELLT